jgi:hypothetical protein
MSIVGAIGGVARRACVILVPVATTIEPECERSLAQLEARGYVVRRVFGNAAIDQARSQMASDALADGFDEIMWIDADIGFDPDAIETLRAHGLPVVCGIYAKKGQRALSCNILPTTTKVTFGVNGGLLEIAHAATGFLLTRRSVYEDIARQCELPRCNEHFGRPVIPYFLPMVIPHEGGHWYLGEDFAFSERARRSGYRVMADTTIRLSHIGRFGYCIEDAGADRPRYAQYDFHLTHRGALDQHG